MKRLFMLVILIMGLGCLAMYAQSSKRQQGQESDTQKVRELVESKRYVIQCDRVYPMRGQSRYVGSDYSIEMKGDTLRSYLPYFGVAHSASYGSKNVLDFEKVHTDYTCTEGKKETILVSFTVENENERLQYHLTIYPNGTVRVFIQPMKRDSISYSGKLE